MKKVRLPIFVFLILLSITLVMVACGPAGDGSANADADDNAASPSGETGNSGTTSTTSTTTNGPHFEVQAGSEMVTEEGLPAGFTVDGRPFLGNPAAPVFMEEFSDYQCPFCSRFYAQTLPSLLENQIANGEVVLVYYDFPLTNIHPEAFAASHAARCAGEVGANAYWAMHDELFGNLDDWSGRSDVNDVFTGYADAIGLDETAFQECMASDKYEEAILEDIRLAQERGVRSTPSFFFNDNLIAGAQPLSTFEQAIAAVASGEPVAAAQPTAAPAVAPTPAAIPLDDVAGTLGNPNAPVTIIEYTDYQCPFCQRHVLETMPRMMAELIETGRVYYLMKDFPLDNLHPEARQAHAAARCAGEQEAYWEMHDALFASQQEWSGQGDQANTIFSNLAGELDLDVGDFNECQQSGKYDDVIEANFQEGARLGVRGTPSFFINGYPIQGAQQYDLFAYAVDLAEKDELAAAYAQPEPQQQQAEAPPAPTGPVEVPLDNAVFAVGDPDAPVTIVEYTDFQCPFCTRHFQQTYPQILSEYVETGMVRYVFKDFPLTSIHPQAVAAAEAARCANDQGAYLEMHDLLFNRQGDWSGQNNTTEIFTSFADSLGLDTDTFTGCLENNTHEAAVLADLAEGQQLGVRGTPAFFINGYLISGAQPFSTFQQAIVELASEAEAQ